MKDLANRHFSNSQKKYINFYNTCALYLHNALWMNENEHTQYTAAAVSVSAAHIAHTNTPSFLLACYILISYENNFCVVCTADACLLYSTEKVLSHIFFLLCFCFTYFSWCSTYLSKTLKKKKERKKRRKKCCSPHQVGIAFVIYRNKQLTGRSE